MTVSGTVDIGGKTFLVESLSTELEIGLECHLAKLCREAMGPAGYFARIQEAIVAYKAAGLHAEAMEIVRETARLQATDAPPTIAAIQAFRQTPKGAAAELFWRTRQTHKEVNLPQIEAIVTTANAFDVYRQIVEAITQSGKGQTPSPSPGG